LPLGQTGLHAVERRRQRTQVIVLNHRQPLAEVPGRNAFGSVAPPTANAKAAASMGTFDHAAKDGRERGRESPTPVSPAMATLAGRSAASTKLCRAISRVPIPTPTPKIPYWTSRHPVAPAIAPPTTANKAA